MLCVVIDTSSLVSYVLTRGELMRRVVAHWRAGAFTLLSSPATRTELADVLARPAIRQLATAPLDELVRGLERFSENVPGVLDLAGACRDAKEDKFLACAMEGGAHYLVSSDSDLLGMRRYRTVAIVNPGQFLLALELYPMEVRALATRFGHDVLADIQATVPLEPDTAARVVEALAVRKETSREKQSTFTDDPVPGFVGGPVSGGKAPRPRRPHILPGHPAKRGLHGRWRLHH